VDHRSGAERRGLRRRHRRGRGPGRGLTRTAGEDNGGGMPPLRSWLCRQ
jgi:hypothetical protein